jgi:AcrR family transcriptional regulator
MLSPLVFANGHDMLTHDIAARLEALFSQRGFAEPSVSELKAAADVSLRTLYRHFPSKESMVIGALQHRHERYLAFLENDVPAHGAGALSHLYQRLAHWMQHEAPNGCMSVNALAAFPDNTDVRDTVLRHKREILQWLGDRSGQPTLATELFLIHEGASSAWLVLGRDAIVAARSATLTLLGESGT